MSYGLPQSPQRLSPRRLSQLPPDDTPQARMERIQQLLRAGPAQPTQLPVSPQQRVARRLRAAGAPARRSPVEGRRGRASPTPGRRHVSPRRSPPAPQREPEQPKQSVLLTLKLENETLRGAVHRLGGAVGEQQRRERAMLEENAALSRQVLCSQERHRRDCLCVERAVDEREHRWRVLAADLRRQTAPAGGTDARVAAARVLTLEAERSAWEKELEERAMREQQLASEVSLLRAQLTSALSARRKAEAAVSPAANHRPDTPVGSSAERAGLRAAVGELRDELRQLRDQWASDKLTMRQEKESWAQEREQLEYALREATASQGSAPPRPVTPSALRRLGRPVAIMSPPQPYDSAPRPVRHIHRPLAAAAGLQSHRTAPPRRPVAVSPDGRVTSVASSVPPPPPSEPTSFVSSPRVSYSPSRTSPTRPNALSPLVSPQRVSFGGSDGQTLLSSRLSVEAIDEAARRAARNRKERRTEMRRRVGVVEDETQRRSSLAGEEHEARGRLRSDCCVEVAALDAAPPPPAPLAPGEQRRLSTRSMAAERTLPPTPAEPAQAVQPVSELESLLALASPAGIAGAAAAAGADQEAVALLRQTLESGALKPEMIEELLASLSDPAADGG
eukprot:TRINITY_DN28721_c0_g1_i1.p2 TRINITY_DN28721_c0_g1~~TRINITY_DN28721_c0_g1_i1.p2  ORF type:complete len:620 (+),score=247.68 TRINITY_DN28721_c0_g1_i1:55-1914(+)